MNIVVPLIPSVVCPLLSFVVYVLSQKRLNTDGQHRSKAFIFYRMMSGTLFGEVIARLYFFSSIWLSSFVAIGFIGYDTCEMIARIWNTNRYYVAPDDNTHEDVSLDISHLVTHNIIVSDDLTSDDSPKQMFQAQDLHKSEIKRYWILGSMYVIFTILSIADGLLLVANPPTDVQSLILKIFFYLCTSTALSTCIYSGMIHAKFHTEEKKRRLKWIVATAVWCIILFCTIIPLLVGVTNVTALLILNNFALLAFFGFAVGCLLKINVYFHNMKIDRMDKTDLIWGSFVFILSTAQAIASGFFL